MMRSSGMSLDARQTGQRHGQESSADMRLDGDQVTADPDDGDAGHTTRTYIRRLAARPLQVAEP